MAPHAKKFGFAAIAAASTLLMGAMALPTEASAQFAPGARHGARVAPRVAAQPRVAAGRYGGGARYGYRGGGRGWNRGGAAAAGIIGGLALGAIAAGAMAQPAPVYEDACHLERQRYWNGYRWRIRNVEVCP